MAQYFRIDMPWDGEGSAISLCPSCGAGLFEEEGCRHRLFVYSDEGGEFEYVADEISPLIDDLPEDDDDDERSLPEIVTSRIERSGVICLHTTADSTGGGVAVCLDVAWGSPPEDE